MKKMPSRVSLVCSVVVCITLYAQAPPLVPGPNVNMVMTSPGASGDLTTKLDPPVTACQGLQPCNDTKLQWENEPSCDGSPRNPRTIACGSNDARLVGPDANNVCTSDTGCPEVDSTAAVWCAHYRSNDGGQTWQSTLLPGYPGDTSKEGLASPLKGFKACGDPAVRFHPNGLLFQVAGGFNSGNNALTNLSMFRFMHNNVKENADSTTYLDANQIDIGTAGIILDRPSLAVGLPPQGALTCNIPEQKDKNGKTIAPAQSFPCGTAYVAYGFFKGSDPNAPKTSDVAEVRVARSIDGAKTWAINKPFQTYPLVNFASVAVAPRASGVGQDTVYVAVRLFETTKSKNSFLLAKSTDGGKSWGKPAVVAEFANADELFIQPKSLNSFCVQCPRTNPAPAITVDEKGTVYMAFSMRLGPKGTTAGSLRDARIVVSVFPNGNVGPLVTAIKASDGSVVQLTPGTSLPATSVVVESPLDPASYLTTYNTNGRGQEFMPIIANIRGKIVVGWGDSRNSGTRLAYTQAEAAAGAGHREALAVPSDAANRFNNFISDFYVDSNGQHQKLKFRQTLEMRIAYAELYDATKNPSFVFFTPSVRGTRFQYGASSKRGDPPKTVDVEANPATSLTSSGGTKPFLGDFFDFGYQRIVMTPSGPRFNSSLDNLSGIFAHADNRRVRPPLPCCPVTSGPCLDCAKFNITDGNTWTAFTPVGPQDCVVGQTGVRNQELYEFRFSQGLIAEFFFNSKPLNTVFPREFALVVQNTRSIPGSFRLTIANQPMGGQASLKQKSLLTSLDVNVGPRSSISRPVHVTSSDSRASVTVNVQEITTPGGTLILGGLQASAVINPDRTNPDTVDPDNAPPGSSISSAESYNPNVGFAQVCSRFEAANGGCPDPTPTNFDANSNSGITNPTFTDPDLTDPDLTEPFTTDPDLTDPDLTDPDLTDPDLTDPDLTDPDLTLPDFSSQTLADTTFPVSSESNTSSSIGPKLFATDALKICPKNCSGGACPQDCRKLQMVLRRVTRNLTAHGCQLRATAQNTVIANVTSSSFAANTDPDLTDPDLTDPDLTDPDLTDPDLTNASLTLPPGDGSFDPTKVTPGSVRWTLRSVTPNPGPGSIVQPATQDGGPSVNFVAKQPEGLTTAVRSVLTAHSTNTGDLGNASAKGPKTLTISTTNEFNPPPVGLLCVPFRGYTLQAIGGVAPLGYTWCLAQPQPPGSGSPTLCPASPNPATLSNGLLLSTGAASSGGGVITSGGAGVQTCFTNSAPGLTGSQGLKSFNIQVQDSAPSPAFPSKHVNTEQLNIQINKLEIRDVTGATTGVTACLKGTGPGTALACVTNVKNDDLITVRVTVLNNTGVTLAINNPRATVDNVSATALTVIPTGTAGSTCGAPSPTSVSISGNASQVFTYTCGPVSPAGTLTFRAGVGVSITVPTAGFFVIDANKDSNAVTVVNPK